MDCQTAQEQILESLAESQPRVASPELEGHLAGCEGCRGFAQTQIVLDLQLSAAISAPALSPTFHASLMKRVRSEALSGWSEFLPDVAHIAGCVCATALCLYMLPLPSGMVVLAGLAFTLVTYFVQTVLRGSLETWDEGAQ